MTQSTSAPAKQENNNNLTPSALPSSTTTVTAAPAATNPTPNFDDKSFNFDFSPKAFLGDSLFEAQQNIAELEVALDFLKEKVSSLRSQKEIWVTPASNSKSFYDRIDMAQKQFAEYQKKLR